MLKSSHIYSGDLTVQAYTQGAVYPGYDSGFLLLLILSLRVFFQD